MLVQAKVQKEDINVIGRIPSWIMLFSNKELYTFFLTSNKFEEEQHTIPNGATKLAEKTLFFWNLMQARPIWFKLFKSWQPSFASQTSVKPCWLSFQSKRSSILTDLPPDFLVHFQKNSKISIWYYKDPYIKQNPE